MSLGANSATILFLGGSRIRMLLTYKTRIEPTSAQCHVLWELSEQCRLLYNFTLQERLHRLQQERPKPKAHRKYLTYVDQQNALPQLKAQHPEFRWVYSKVLQLVLRTLDANFKSLFGLRKRGDPKAKPLRFKGQQFFTTLKYNQSGFQLREGILTLSHKHPSKIALAFWLPYLPAGTIKQVELYHEPRTDRWFVSFNCQVELPPTLIMSCTKRLTPGSKTLCPRSIPRGNCSRSRIGVRTNTGAGNSQPYKPNGIIVSSIVGNGIGTKLNCIGCAANSPIS